VLLLVVWIAVALIAVVILGGLLYSLGGSVQRLRREVEAVRREVPLVTRTRGSDHPPA
jgi:hypothetical protein